MSKPSLRLHLTKLVFYHILLWQLGRWPQSKFHCRADGALLQQDEVFALQAITRDLELKQQQTITDKSCDGTFFGFTINCDCNNATNQCSISKIEINNLDLTGTIHEAVSYLSNLKYLSLANNKLHGSIPDTWGNLMDLEYLDLSSNQLSGLVPASLGNLVSLQNLYLNNNLLSGGIPRNFGLLTNLIQMAMQFNKLSGSIPEDFGKLSSLSYMDLSENQLSGPLPESLGNLSSLGIFYVSANYLSEEFPKGYDRLTSLELFSIAGNYISGPLPVETMASWTNIYSLNVMGNNFEGNSTTKYTEIFNLPNLQYLLITDLANNSFPLPPKINNSANFISLTLRNCSINGTIPKYIGENMTSLRYLDLSFNKLTGGLPQKMSSKMIYMSFSRNMLNGAIAPSILGDSQTRIDLSFNNFSAEGSPVQSNQQLNLFACCRNSSTTEPQMMDPFEMKNRYCPEKEPKYHSLFINCGGEETIVNGHKYDQDNDTSLFYTSLKKSWAYSLSGDFGVPESNTSNYIKSMTRGVPEAPLYEKARFSPISLEYYVFCLRKGNYIVTLYFKEIVDSKDEDYSSLRKRVFDVYIQDVRRLNYFKIREEEGTTEGPITKKISAVVVNDSGLLNIHLYWPGKGSYQYHPSFNGPLISAISVTPELSPDKNKGQLVALITLASIVAALPLSLAFAWRMGWLPSEEFPKIETSQEKIVDEHQDSEELPRQEENGDEQRNTKDQGKRKNTEKDQGQEEIGDEHQDSEELPSQEEIGDDNQDSEELPSQEEIGDEPRNTKGQEEIGDEQRNTKDQGRRKNTKTKRKKKEKIGDEHPDIIKKLGMFGLSYGFPLGMSSEELPSQEEIGDEHQDSEELPSQEEIGDEQRNTKGQQEISDEQRNTKDQGRRKNTETKRKKKEKIGDDHPETVKKLGMLGLSYGFSSGMSSEELPSQEEIGEEHQDSEELPSQEEIGDEHQDSEELPSQEEIGDEQRNTKGQEEIGDEQRNTKDQGRRKNTETKRKKKEKIGDERPNTVKKLGMFGLSYGLSLDMSSEELPSQEEIGDEHQDSEELPSQQEIGDEQRNKKGQEEIGDEQRNTKDQGRWNNTETKTKKKEKIGDKHPDTVKKLGMLGLSYGFPLGMSSEELPSEEEIGDEHQYSEELPSQEEIGDEQRNTKEQGRRKNTETKRKKNEKIGDERPNTVKKLGMFGLSYGLPLDMSSEELPSQEEIGDEHQDSEELPSQQEIGDEQRNKKGQEEIGDEQRNTKDQGRWKNTETKTKKKEKIGDKHPDTVKKLGMLGLSYGFPLGMSSEELPSEEEIGDEHQDSEELPSQEEIGVEQRNTKDQGRRKNTETKRKKNEKIGDERPNTVKKLGMFGLSYGLPLDMSSEELPSQEEIGDEHQDSEELPSQEEIGDEQRNTKGQEEIGDEQRNTKDQGRRKNTETKMKKKEKIGDEHPDTVKKLGMLGLSYGFPLGMSSEELLSQEEIGDEHQDSEELRSQEEISDEQRNTKGQEEIGDEQINTKDQGRRKNTETKRKKNEKIGDEHLDAVKELINATENFSDKKKLGHSETFFMAQLPSHTVAVKKLDSAHFKGKIVKLKEEIGIIESLQHNNILKLLHAYIGKDLQFLVYEYMENKSLEDILFGSSTSGTIKLDWNTRVNICLGIARGLQYLHERVQIVHTNIKSANILLNEKLEAKISDFGFANLYSEEDKVMAIARETKKGYTAPEYLQTDDLDSKLDVFSFGVVILEIVSGERNVRNQSKKETEVLLDRAYKANRNGNLKSLVDKNLSTYDEREALIILKLALECTTMGASVRPEMSGVVSVLLGEKSIDEVCSPAKPTGDINVVGSLEELAGISDMAAKPTGDINVVGSLEESAGISDMAESLSPLWGS
ncbi:uncharacterized protein LOC126586491 isoform X3 [Malus sylvestris]|uniref:uncharacterized protein LOC126586491 isoform X3 n=1 Tax=Malus sylvestris TaxID=3752 RepID=UPI0021AC84B7|nr:uncharacterized protein LOC126586491 isoform X3 [Malus sylvestris]